MGLLQSSFQKTPLSCLVLVEWCSIQMPKPWASLQIAWVAEEGFEQLFDSRFTLGKRFSNQWLIRHMCLCGRAVCWRRELLQHPGHESFERQIHCYQGNMRKEGTSLAGVTRALMLLRKSFHILKKESELWLSNRSYVKCRGGLLHPILGEQMRAFHLQGERQLQWFPYSEGSCHWGREWESVQKGALLLFPNKSWTKLWIVERPGRSLRKSALPVTLADFHTCNDFNDLQQQYGCDLKTFYASKVT